MAFVAGNFDDAAYNKAKVTMANMMADKFALGHLRQPTPIFDAMTSRQSIRVGGQSTVQLPDGRRCEGVDVSWLNICDLSVNTGTVDCDLDGDELGAQMKTYLNNQTFHKAIKIPDSQCKDVHILNEKRALALLGIRAALDQELERRIITFFNANADDLDGFTPPVGTIDGVDTTEWDIDESALSADLFIDLEKVAMLLNFQNPMVVDGDNFYSLIKKADAKIAGNCCNTDKLFDLLPIYQNIKTVDQVSGAARTFLIESANVAYFNSTINSNASPVSKGDMHNTRTWRMPSLRLKWRNNGQLVPVYYDMKMQYKCISGNDYQEVYHGEHRGAFITGATNCDDRAGIVKITANSGG